MTNKKMTLRWSNGFGNKKKQNDYSFWLEIEVGKKIDVSNSLLSIFIPTFCRKTYALGVWGLDIFRNQLTKEEATNQLYDWVVNDGGRND